MITFHSNNPQIIFLALAILIGSIAALLYVISDYRRNAIAWHAFKRVLQRKLPAGSTYQAINQAFEEELIGLLRGINQELQGEPVKSKEALRKLAKEMAGLLQRLDPEFDRQRFLAESDLEFPD